jgi:putative peptidoglycan lipid II flippase
MFVSLFSIALNFCLNYTLTLKLGFGHKGLALSTSVVALTNFALLYLMMRKYAGRLETGAMFSTLAKLLVAGVCLGTVCWFGTRFFFGAGIPLSEVRKLIGVGTIVVVASAVFFGVAYMLRVAELHDLVEVVRRKVKR